MNNELIPHRIGYKHDVTVDGDFVISYCGELSDENPRSNPLWRVYAHKNSPVGLTWKEAKDYAERVVGYDISDQVEASEGMPATTEIEQHPYIATDVCLSALAYCPINAVIYEIESGDKIVSFAGFVPTVLVEDDYSQNVSEVVTRWIMRGSSTTFARGLLAHEISKRVYWESDKDVLETTIIPLPDNFVTS